MSVFYPRPLPSQAIGPAQNIGILSGQPIDNQSVQITAAQQPQQAIAPYNDSAATRNAVRDSIVDTRDSGGGAVAQGLLKGLAAFAAAKIDKNINEAKQNRDTVALNRATNAETAEMTALANEYKKSERGFFDFGKKDLPKGDFINRLIVAAGKDPLTIGGKEKGRILSNFQEINGAPDTTTTLGATARGLDPTGGVLTKAAYRAAGSTTDQYRSDIESDLQNHQLARLAGQGASLAGGGALVKGLGLGTKVAAAAGAALGAGTSVADDLVENQPVNIGGAAVSAGIGGALGGIAGRSANQFVRQGGGVLSKSSKKADEFSGDFERTKELIARERAKKSSGLVRIGRKNEPQIKKLDKDIEE
ncbi:MAG: hypothetical protein ORO03_10250, partial [Alphaproteobacteria bacterium]|nr:hypothetical protein [Alphaproteobacteria bacterium]